MAVGIAPDSRWLTVVVAFSIGAAGFVAGIAVGFVVGAVATAAGITLAGVALVAFSLLALQGIGFPVTAWAYLRYREADWSYLGIKVPDLREVGIIVAATIGALVVAFMMLILVQVVGAPTAERTDQELLMNPDVLLALIPLAFLVIGPGEEILFRGVIQTVYREHFSAPVAILLASAAFAPAHIVSFTGSATALFVSISILFVPSIVFGAVYEYTGNLVVPAVTHGFYNAVLFGLVYISVQYLPEQTETILVTPW